MEQYISNSTLFKMLDKLSTTIRTYLDAPDRSRQLKGGPLPVSISHKATNSG